jgi:hypothetical protein
MTKKLGSESSAQKHQRSFRSNTSTPVSTNTTATSGTRKSKRLQQPSNETVTTRRLTINDEEYEEDEEPLQTQLPMLTHHQEQNGEDYDNKNDGMEAVTMELRSPGPSNGDTTTETTEQAGKRTARKTTSDNTTTSRHKSSTGTAMKEDVEVDHEEEVEEEVVRAHLQRPVATGTTAMKPEDDGGENSTGNSINPPKLNTTMVKYHVHQYSYDILDQEQHIIIFDRSARILHWPILQVRFFFLSFSHKRGKDA